MKPMTRHTVAFLLLGSAALWAGPAPEAVAKPNILFVISDDQGYSDFGFTGNRVVRTPHLDRLAGQSAVFTDFVVAAACSPSRAAFYTGREHLATGVWGVPPRANLRRDEVLAPAFFQHAGYRTLHVGKPDTARTNESQPWNRGWDNAFVIDGGYLHRDPIIAHRDGSARVEGWTADILTERALEFIRAADRRPWFMTVAYIIPHLPWVCDETFSAPFREQGLSPQLSACYGAIAQLDGAIGRLLAGLAESGQEARTLVVFVSDNGMAHLAGDGSDGHPKEPLSEADWKIRNLHALRGHKATIWENGIRVPMLVRWPGRIAPGSRPQFGCAEDVLPTLLDLAGVPVSTPTHLPFTGRSLRPALEDPGAPDTHPGAFRMAIAFAGAPRAPTGIIPDPQALRYEQHHLALRGPRFKFHALPDGTSALYDLLADPGETTDVRERFPEVALTMAAECRRRWDEILAGGRAFGMPTLLIGGPETSGRPTGANIVPGSAAQALTGRVRVVAQNAQGFVDVGDSARYALDVRLPGNYRIMLRGQGLDACAPLRITLGDATLNSVSATPEAADFGVISLAAGPLTLELAVAGPRPEAESASIRQIVLTAGR
ncbi:MAG: sulfatase-like hydrolase/transferase [Lentisphaeria bacterium]|nr:sulfatase-like hydrolase/transferase [Lentisphaeria bacterium]